MLLLAAVALGALASACVIILADETPAWRAYQAEFRAIVAERLADVPPDQIPSGIQQIWIKELDRVDRCTTCHQGITWKGLEGVEQPWTSHPNPALLAQHPLGEFGCTLCHAGQGYAVDEAGAHGFVRHWPEPLLSKTIASEYDPRTPPPLEQIRCNKCHRYERETPGMDYINHAKALVRSKGCKVCHIINGEGGRLGPDLSTEGDKSPEGYDFSHLASDAPTIFKWHIAHFKSPLTVVPGSLMPEMGFQSKDAQALAMLVMSWKEDASLPRRYLPGIALRDQQTAEERQQQERMLSGDGAFFVKHSCFVCHSIKAFGIESPTNKGPDLSFAPDDVRTRFSKTVEEFIFEPTGTMKIIFESQIVLSKEEKWEAINKIRKAYSLVTNVAPEDHSPK